MWLLPWRSSGKKDKQGSPVSKRKGATSAPPSPRPPTKAFGVLLDAVPKAPGSKIPLIVEVTVKHLREAALDTEGIFRVPGSVAEVNELIRVFDEGQQINLKQYDLHAVAGVLKKFFRDLPSPLIISSLNAQIAALFRNGAIKGPIEDILARMRAILFHLPTVNFETLKCVVSLLVDIYQHTSINKMSLSNLVTCIVPSLDCSPAIITYSIQNFDFFFSEPQTPSTLTHSAPQVIRHSISPAHLQFQSMESPLATSPRHTIALPSPSSWFTPPPPNWSSITPSAQDEQARRSQSPQNLHARRSQSPKHAARSSVESSGITPQFSSSLTISLPPSPHHSPTLLSSPIPARMLSASGGLLPPPPRATASPSRRNFLADRLSVAMTTSYSTPSPHAQQLSSSSLSLQLANSYPHSPSAPSPAPWQLSPRALASSYSSDWSAFHKPPALTRQLSDLVERPRASSHVPQPTFLFGSEGEAEDKPTRRQSLTAKSQDPLRYSRSTRGKKDKDYLFDDEKDKGKEKDRKSKERLKDKERRKEREREKEREKERDKGTYRDRRKLSYKNDKENGQKKIEELRADIQRERERSESAAARSAEIEARLRREESHSNSLKVEIERLKRRIQRRSRSNSTFDADNEDDLDSEGEAENDTASPASHNIPRDGSAGKLDVKIRMPFPY